MSLTTELEELLREKAQLKGMLQSMEEEEKYLGKRLRIVEEKIEIQVLKEKIKAKRAVVEQLKSKIWDLEKRLKEPMEVTVSAAPTGSQQPKKPEEQKEKQQEIKERRFFP